MPLPHRIRLRWLVLATSCVALTVGGACWRIGRCLPGRPAVPPDGPRLLLDKSPRDLGVVLPGEAQSLQYEIVNSGNRDLEITDLHTSCGCAPAKLDQNPIPPGWKGLIYVSFHAPLAAGRVAHVLSFRTNDPEHPNIELAFGALAKRPVEVIPLHVYAGVLLPGQEVVHKVELCSTDAVAFEVKSISPSADWVHVEPLPDEASFRHQFRVSIKGQVPPGPFSAAIRFTTSCPEQKEILVPVAGEIASSLRITPESLLRRSAHAGSAVDVKMMISAVGDAPPLQSVTVKSEDWRVLEWKAVRASPSAWRLLLRVRVPAASGYKRSVLLLRGPARADVQEVPLGCLVRRAGPSTP